jgi:hypothetical protein
MNDLAQTSAPEDGVIDSRSGFHAALRGAFAAAASHGCREILLSDRDFADWPLGDPAVIDALSRWAFSHRRLTVIAAHFDELARRHMRFVQWRVSWAHVVDCRAAQPDDVEHLPVLWYAPGLMAVRLHDAQHYRGRVYRTAADLARCREAIDAIAQRSFEAFPVTTLGL